MHQLIYISIPRSNFSDTDLSSILVSARKHNEINSITGLLFFDGVYFLQFLEGDRTDVDQLFARIQNDPRHLQIKVIFTDSPQTRIFPGWSMASVSGPLSPLSQLIKKWHQQGTISSQQDLDILFRSLDGLVKKEDALL